MERSKQHSVLHYRRSLQATIAATWRVIWPILRQVLGWLFIVLGILGIFLPILQGVLFLVIGVTLVGHRNPVVRWVSARYKVLLRRWATLETPLVGPTGRLLLRMHRESARQYRRARWNYAEWRRQRAEARVRSMGDEI